MTIDDQIRSSLAATPIEAGPTPEVREAVEDAAARMRRRRSRVGAVSACFVAISMLVVVLVAWPESAPEVSTAGAPTSPATSPVDVPDDWVEVVDPVLGWTLWVPPAWTARSFEAQCRIGESGTIVRSNGEPPPFETRLDGCTTERDWAGMAPDSVVVELAHQSGGPAQVPTPGTTLVPTTFPLVVPDDVALRVADTPWSGWAASVVVGEDGSFVVSVRFGVGSSPEDRDAARLVVASMRPPAEPPIESPAPEPTPQPGSRTVALPSRPVPADGQLPEALIGGVLARAGDCLYLESVVTGELTAIVWFGGATMTVPELGSDELLGVTVDGIPLPTVDGNLSFGGGWRHRSQLEDGTFAVDGLQPDCLTDQVVFLYPRAEDAPASDAGP